MIFSAFRPKGLGLRLPFHQAITLLLAVSSILIFTGGITTALAQEQKRQTDVILRITGSTTIQPIIEDVAEAYVKAYGETLEIQGGGSSTGIRAVLTGEAEVGMVSRSLSAEEQKLLASTIIGYDALAIIVNKRNPRTEINSRELQDIYTGRVRNWDAGPDWAREIVLISKKPGRGTLVAFEEFTGLSSPAHSPQRENVKLIAAHAWEAGANLEATLWVGGIPGAIGYVSFGDADRFISLGQPIRKLALDGVMPDQITVAKGRYPMRRELNLVYRQDDSRAKAFAGFLTSATAQRVLRQKGFVPVSSQERRGEKR